MTAPSEFLTVKEAAQRFRVSDSTIYLLLSERRVTAYRVRSTFRIPLRDLEAALLVERREHSLAR